MDKTLKQIADKIEKYMQNDYADEWHIELNGNSIIGYYTDVRVFILDYDEDVEDWYISGANVNVETIVDINKILREK